MSTKTVIPPAQDSTSLKGLSFNDITKQNLKTAWSAVISSLNAAAFVAIDIEFTGLGSDQRATKAANIEDRYAALSEVAKTHAIVAFGLSVFELDKTSTSPAHKYIVNNWNFTLLCQDEHQINAKSMKFLVDNGFNFNRQYKMGIPYFPGNDKTSKYIDEDALSYSKLIRNLFLHITSLTVPVVVHNGLLDLLFLYHGLFSSLPKKLSEFVADLHAMFPGGLYDTKYVAEFVTREGATYLPYLFRKYEREQRAKENESQSQSKSIPHLSIRINPRLELPEVPISTVSITSPPLNSKESTPPFCKQYAVHGWCKLAFECPHSHDLDVILDYEARASLSKKRKRELQAAEQSGSDINMNGDVSPSTDIINDSSFKEKETIATPAVFKLNSSPLSTPSPIVESVTTVSTSQQDLLTINFEKYHSASFDSYMTGYVYARDIVEYTSEQVVEWKNKLYLMGKDVPLSIHKSAFSTVSAGYKEKLKNRGNHATKTDTVKGETVNGESKTSISTSTSTSNPSNASNPTNPSQVVKAVGKVKKHGRHKKKRKNHPF